VTKTKVLPKLDRSKNVVALVYDDLCTFEFGIVAEIFGLARPELNKELYRFSSVALEKAPSKRSICSGGYLLAEAGLLANRRATTHWKYADDFKESYPEVIVEENEIYIDEGNIVTSIDKVTRRSLFSSQCQNRVTIIDYRI